MQLPCALAGPPVQDMRDDHLLDAYEPSGQYMERSGHKRHTIENGLQPRAGEIHLPQCLWHDEGGIKMTIEDGAYWPI